MSQCSWGNVRSTFITVYFHRLLATLALIVVCSNRVTSVHPPPLSADVSIKGTVILVRIIRTLQSLYLYK